MRTKIEGGRGRDHAVSKFKNRWRDFEHGVEEVANSAGEESENYSLEREVGGVVAIEDVVDCERDGGTSFKQASGEAEQEEASSGERLIAVTASGGCN